MYQTLILITFGISTFITGIFGQGPIEPEIVERIRTEVKKFGQTGYLNCTISNKGPSNTVYWQKLNPGKPDSIISKDNIIKAPNDPIHAGVSGDKTMYKYDINVVPQTNNLLTYRLVIRQLITDDGGQYKCIVLTNSEDDNSKKTFKVGELVVQSPPRIDPSRTTNTAEPDLGEDFKLQCYASGEPRPKIKWTRQDGQPLPNGQKESIGNEYLIKNVSKEHRGVYRCVANNNVKPPDEHDARVVVRYPPGIRAVQNTIGQAENRQLTVKLECEVWGYPEPIVQWFIIDPGMQGKRRKLERDNKYDITQTSWSADQGSDAVRLNILVIKNVRSNDYADYYCSAYNGLGDSEASIHLYETAQCQGSDCPDAGGVGLDSVIVTASFWTIFTLSLSVIFFSLYNY